MEDQYCCERVIIDKVNMRVIMFMGKVDKHETSYSMQKAEYYEGNLVINIYDNHATMKGINASRLFRSDYLIGDIITGHFPDFNFRSKTVVKPKPRHERVFGFKTGKILRIWEVVKNSPFFDTKDKVDLISVGWSGSYSFEYVKQEPKKYYCNRYWNEVQKERCPIQCQECKDE